MRLIQSCASVMKIGWHVSWQRRRLPFSAKLHCTDTGYGHVVQRHQRTSSQQFYNLQFYKFTTNGQKFATSQHLDISRCWALALRYCKFVVQQVVELLWACPSVVLYNMSVAGVRVVEFGTYHCCCVLDFVINNIDAYIHNRHADSCRGA